MKFGQYTYIDFVQANINRNNQQEILFTLSYAVWLCFYILNSSMFSANIQGILKVINVFCAIVLLIYEVSLEKRYQFKALGVLCIIGVLAISFINAERFGNLESILFIIFARNLPFRKLAKVTTIIIATMLTLVIICSLLNIIPNYIASASGRNRAYLGFRYALYAGRYMFAITCLILYLKNKNLRLIDGLILFIFNYLIYYFSDSRTAFYLAAVAIVTVLILKNRTLEKSRLLIKSLITFSFIIAAFISVILSMKFDNSIAWMHTLNLGGMLSGRLSMGHDAFEIYGISLLGQPVLTAGLGFDAYGKISVTDNYFYLDCLYIELLIRYGLIAFLVFILTQTAVLRIQWKRNNITLVIVLTLIAVYCMIDNVGMILPFNPFLFLTGQLLNKINAKNYKFPKLDRREIINSK